MKAFWLQRQLEEEEFKRGNQQLAKLMKTWNVCILLRQPIMAMLDMIGETLNKY